MKSHEFITEEELPSVKTHSVDEIAKKFNVSIPTITDQLTKGIGIEHEHTKDTDLAKEIALDHLWEMPDYYDRLEDMEQGE